MSAFNITVEGGKTVRLPTAGKYCDRDIIVTANGGDSIGAWKFIVDEAFPCDHLSIVNGVLFCTGEWAHYVCRDDFGSEVGYADSENSFDLSVLDKTKTYHIYDGDLGFERGTLVFDVNASYDVVRNQDKVITENGVYSADNGYTGFGKVTVSVPQTGGGVAVGGVNKLPQVVDKSVTEITEDDLQGATQIGIYAFAECYKLEEITIPESVTAIRSGAFYMCERLKTVRVKGAIPPSLDDRHVFIDTQAAIVVDAGCGNIYKNATTWCDIAQPIEEEGGGSTGGGSTGGDGNWLFKDAEITTERMYDYENLLEKGASYTAFVNGEEIATKTCDGFGEINFASEDWSVFLIGDFSPDGFVSWFFHPVDSQVTSGTVSIRING